MKSRYLDGFILESDTELGQESSRGAERKRKEARKFLAGANKGNNMQRRAARQTAGDVAIVPCTPPKSAQTSQAPSGSKILHLASPAPPPACFF